MKTSLVMSAIDNISPETSKVTKSQAELKDSITKTRLEASKANKTLSNISAYEKAKDATTKAESAHKRYETQLNNQRAALKNLAAPTLAQKQKLAALEQQTSDASLALKTKVKTLSNLEQSLHSTGIDTDNLASSQSRLTVEASKHSEVIKKQSKRLRDLTESQRQSTTAADEARKSAIAGANAGVNAGIGIGTASLVGSGVAAVSNQRSYMSVQSAASDWSSDEHKDNNQWTQKFASLEESGGNSAEGIQQLQAAAIKAGDKTVEKSQAAVKLMVKMMTTTGMDITEASLAFTQLKNSGLDNNGIENLIGKANKNYAGTDKAEYITSLSESAARGKDQGLSIDTANSIGLMLSKVSMPASELATTLESMSEFAAKTTYSEADQITLAKVGLSGESKAAMYKEDPIKLIEYLAEKTKGMASGDKQEIYDLSLGSGFQSFMNIDEKIIAEMKAGKGDSSTLQADFDMKTGDSKASIDSLISSVNYLAISIGTPLLDPIATLAQSLGAGVRGVADFAAKTPEATAVVVGLTTVLIAAKGAMAAKGLFSGLKNIKAGVINLNGPIAGGTGGADPADKESKRNKGKSKMLSGGKMLGGVGALFAGGMLANDLYKGDYENAASSAGTLGGGLAGAKAGAMVGAVGGPAGIAIGGILGGLLGSVLGESIGDKLFGMFGEDEQPNPKETLNNASGFGDSDFSIPEGMATHKVSTTENFDERQKQVTEAINTKTINVNLSGKIEGLTPDIEEALKTKLLSDISIPPEFSREGF